MKKQMVRLLFAAMAAGLLSSCTLSLYTKPAPTATPRILILPTLTRTPAALATPTVVTPTTLPPNIIPTTAVPGITSVPPVAQVPSASFCADGQVTTLIGNFKAALQASNGELLASLVSPVHGMEARYLRDGRVVNYDAAHAKFLFASTFQVDWGNEPGSGLPKIGSFHEVILPALLAVFNREYTLYCNEVKVGGTTYQAAWPYPGINHYSVYFPGTSVNGQLDWHTWLLGFEYVNAKPYLYAILQFMWEP